MYWEIWNNVSFLHSLSLDPFLTSSFNPTNASRYWKSWLNWTMARLGDDGSAKRKEFTGKNYENALFSQIWIYWCDSKKHRPMASIRCYPPYICRYRIYRWFETRYLYFELCVFALLRLFFFVIFVWIGMVHLQISLYLRHGNLIGLIAAVHTLTSNNNNSNNSCK